MEGTRLSAYKLISELGSGGMGKVYLAETTRPVAGIDEGERVALKIVHPHLLETEGFFKRFLREADVGKAVTHENVVRTYDCDAVMKDGRQHNFLVMEYVEGQTLRSLLDELRVVPEELCRHIALEIGKALVAIHEAGIVHRDLKPENVLVTEDHVIKVMDLGVARLQDEVIRLSHTGMFVGSVHYAAPEQFMNEGDELDGRADLHALGVMLYELSTGQHPYQSEDFRVVLRAVLSEVPRRVGQLNPQISPFLEEVVTVLTAKQAGDRFDSAAELVGILEEGEESAWWQERAQELRRATHRPLRRMRVPRDTALYGREAELEKLQSLYDQAKAGRGQVLLIQGEAGIGRTRLVDEFVGHLQEQGEDLNFLFGHYPPGGAATAAGAFSTAYREQLGAEGLEETLGEYLTQAPALIPAFAALLRGDPTPKGEQPLNKDSLQTVFVHVTRALAAERPTIILIDDLHFAPEDGRALFASLALAVAEHSVLLICAARPDLPDNWISGLDRQPHFTRLELERLGAREVGKLIHDVFRSQRLADKLGFQIVTKADGNPFFVFEIIRGLREGNYITQSADGTWSSIKEIEEIRIPSSLVDLIESRIADIAEEDRDLLDVASCCGYEFDPGLVADAIGMPKIAALKRLSRLEKKQRLVRSVGRHFTFDHHQIQEAIFEGLPEMLREEYHAALADTLERNLGAADKDPKDLPGATAVDLCEWFFKGRRNEQALPYLDAALGYLEKNYLNDAALHLLDHALGIEGLVTGEARVHLLMRKAQRLGHLGHRDEERATLDEAIPLAASLGDLRITARTQMGLGMHLFRMSRFAEALEALEGVLDLARELHDELLESKVERVLGNAAWSMGRHDDAKAHYERGIELGQKIGDCVEEGGSTNNLANIFNDRGDIEAARALYERAVALLGQGDNKVFECIVTSNLASTSLVLGRLDEARARAEQSLELARSIGYRESEVTGLNSLGSHAVWIGRFGRALNRGQEALTLARELGDRLSEAGTEAGLAGTLGRLGDPDAGRAHAEHALAIVRELESPASAGRILSALGALHLQQRDLGEAERRFQEALSIFREHDYTSEVLGALVSIARCLRTTDRQDEALPLLDEAIEGARKLSATDTLAAALAERSGLPGGDATEVVQLLETRAARLSAETQMRARFLVWQATDDPTHLAEAHRLLADLREHAPAEYRDTMIENVPLHAAITAAWRDHAGSDPNCRDSRPLGV